MKGRLTRSLFILFALLIFSSTAAANLQVDPNTVKKGSPEIYNLSIENEDSGEAKNVTIILPTSNSSEDPFGSVKEDNVDIQTVGWDIAKIWSRDNDSYGDSIKLSSQEGEGLKEGQSLVLELILDSTDGDQYSWKVDLSNGEEYSSTINIDGNPPERLSVSPKGNQVMKDDPDIVAEFEDAGIGVDTGQTVLRINGAQINSSNLKVNGENMVRYQGNLGKEQNDVALYIEDKFGYSTWINWSFKVTEKPIITDVSPRKGAREKRPVIQALVKDIQGIDLEESYIELNGDKYEDKSPGFNIESLRENDTFYRVSYEPQSNLGGGTHQVDLVVYDGDGHRRKKSWNFSIDREPPSIEKLSVKDGDVVSGIMSLYMEGEDQNSGIRRVVVDVGGITRTVRNFTLNGPLTILEEDINITGSEGGQQVMEISVYDNANNKLSVHRNVTVDYRPPNMREVRLFPNPTNIAPRLRIRASDRDTSVEMAEYYIGDDPGRGQAVSIPISSDSPRLKVFSTRINTSELSEGSQKLYARVKDQAQHWSTSEAIEIEYDPDLDSGLQFTGPETINVRQGKRRSFKTYISNVGTVPAEVTLSIDSKIDSLLDIKRKKIGSGDTRVYKAILRPGEVDIGTYDFELRAESQSSTAEKNLTVVVKADNQTQNKVERRIENLVRRYEEVKGRTDDWIPSLEGSGEINKTIRDVGRTISTALENMEDGDYRYASEEAPKVSRKLNNTKKSLEIKIEEYYDSLILEIILIILAVIITGAIVFFYRSRFMEDSLEGGFEYSATGEPSLWDKVKDRTEKARRSARKTWLKIKKFVRKILGIEKEGWEGFEYS